MSFLANTFLGVRWLIWIFFFVALLCGIGVIIYWKREQIKANYLKWRFPEKVLKVIIHYPSGMYRTFWRLIPDDDQFILDGKTYHFNDRFTEKENDFYIQKKEKFLIVKITESDGTIKEYMLDDRYKIKKKDARFPEVHYFDNVPTPINFRAYDVRGLKFTGQELEEFRKARLFEELLTLEGKKNLMLILIILGVGNLILGLVNLGKLMGWIK